MKLRHLFVLGTVINNLSSFKINIRIEENGRKSSTYLQSVPNLS